MTRQHLPLAALVAATTLLWTGGLAARARSPLEPNLLGEERYAETFTTIAVLEDRTYVQVQVAISNLGAGDGHGGCRALVVPPRGAPWTASDKDKHWSYTEQPHPQLRMKWCKVTARDQFEVDFSLDGGTISLSLDAAVQTVRPPDHSIRSGDRFFQGQILVPWASVSGVLQLPGKPVRTVKGYGYADHSRSTVVPSDLARQWVRFRALNEDESALVLGRFPPERGEAIGWTWRTGEDSPKSFRVLRTRQLAAAERGNAWRVDITRHDGPRWILLSTEVLYRHAPVEELGIVGSLVSAVVGNPVTTTYRAELDTGEGGRIEGILEVTVVDD